MLKIISAVTGLFMLALPALADFQAGKDAYDRGDFAAALEEWRPLADEGDIFAQEKLGDIYANDHGVPQDYALAMKWYRLAADQGDPFAQVDLGSMYLDGLGVAQDLDEARKWYRLAADQGDAYALEKLAAIGQD